MNFFNFQVELTVAITLFNTSNDLHHLRLNHNNDHGEKNEAGPDLRQRIIITDTNRITSQDDRRTPDQTVRHGKRFTRLPGSLPSTLSRWPGHGVAGQHLHHTENTALARCDGLRPQQPPLRRWATGSGQCRTVRVLPPDRQVSQRPCKTYSKPDSLLRCNR